MWSIFCTLLPFPFSPKTETIECLTKTPNYSRIFVHFCRPFAFIVESPLLPSADYSSLILSGICFTILPFTFSPETETLECLTKMPDCRCIFVRFHRRVTSVATVGLLLFHFVEYFLHYSSFLPFLNQNRNPRTPHQDTRLSPHFLSFLQASRLYGHHRIAPLSFCRVFASPFFPSLAHPKLIP